MSGGRTVTLPARQEMLKRLKAVNDSPHVVERLYPALLEYASTSMNAVGIVAMFKLEVGNYCTPFTQDFLRLMERQIPAFIEGLVRDRTVRRQALQLLG